MSKSEICCKCLLTKGTPGISFDKDGVCNYCRDYTLMETEGEERLREQLDKFRNQKSKYECMICVSGGRDSTFTLWKIVHDYGMKALAVTYDSPFLSPQAKENIEVAIKKLDVDHLYWKYPKNTHFDTTKKHLKIWANRPSSQMIPFVCAHCKSWNFKFYKIARDHNIPLIIFGSNPLETASFKKEGFGGAQTYGSLRNIPRIVGKSFIELISNPSYLKANWLMVLKMYLGASHNTPYMRIRNRNVSVIRVFDYIRWNEDLVESTIKENLDWKKSTEVEASWRFDCRLDYLRRLMYHSVIGVTELRDLFSKMIREGMITRKDALKRLEIEEKVPKNVVLDVLDSFDLKMNDVGLDINHRLIKD
ncbi:MAG: hypothetical protein JRI41_09895 [Deltaproteobacteria bacterium]|nr:hypothetical protein [Deltaproteobacteria bacterium]